MVRGTAGASTSTGFSMAGAESCKALTVSRRPCNGSGAKTLCPLLNERTYPFLHASSQPSLQLRAPQGQTWRPRSYGSRPYQLACIDGQRRSQAQGSREDSNEAYLSRKDPARAQRSSRTVTSVHARSRVHMERMKKGVELGIHAGSRSNRDLGCQVLVCLSAARL